MLYNINECEMSLLNNEYFPWTSDDTDRFTMYFSQIDDDERKLYSLVINTNIEELIKSKYNYTLDKFDLIHFYNIQEDIIRASDSKAIQEQMAWVSFMANVGFFLQSIFIKSQQFNLALNMVKHKDVHLYLIGFLILRSKLDIITSSELFHQLHLYHNDLFSLSFGGSMSIVNDTGDSKSYCCIKKPKKTIELTDMPCTTELISKLRYFN